MGAQVNGTKAYTTSDFRAVRGRVRRNDRPLAGVLVRAFDREFRHEDLLGEATTDAEGRYEINYSGERFQHGEKDGPNLVVRVGDGTRPLAASPVLFHAQAVETVDLVAPDVQETEPSEFEQLEAVLRPLLTESLRPI
jgi:hypothetical protein